MNKRIVFILVGLCIHLVALSQSVIEYQPKTNPKKITVYEEYGDKYKKKDILLQIVLDSNGYLVSYETMKVEDFNYKEIYSYNGNKVDTISHIPDSFILDSFVIKHFYKNDLLIKTECLYSPSRNFETTLFAYDNLKRQNEIKYLDKDNKLYYIINIKYDDSLNTIETIEYDENKNVLDKNTSYYDANKKLIRRTNNNTNSNVFYNLEYRYNINGNISEIYSYSIDGTIKSIFKYEYIYDNKNNWTKRIDYLKDNTSNNFNFVETKAFYREIIYY